MSYLCPSDQVAVFTIGFPPWYSFRTAFNYIFGILRLAGRLPSRLPARLLPAALSSDKRNNVVNKRLYGSFQKSGAPDMDQKQQDPSYKDPEIGPPQFVETLVYVGW